MATSVNFSRFLAALAAVLTFALTACGGGEEVSNVQSEAVLPAAFVANSAVPSDQLSVPSGAPQVSNRKRSLAVSMAEAPASASIKASITVAEVGGVTKTMQAVAAPTTFTNAALIDWAEQMFPGLFPGAPLVFEDVVAPDGNRYYARYYAATQNYVGVCLGGGANTCIVGGAYGLGPYTGNILSYFGHKDVYKCQVNVDWCRPTVKANFEDGATNVPPKATVLVFTSSEPIANCQQFSGTSDVGDDGSIKITVTLSCNAAGGTIAVTPLGNRWPFGARSCFTIQGVQNSGGYGSLALKTCFTTRGVQSPRTVYVGEGGGASGLALNVINPVSGTLTKQVQFPTFPGFLAAHNLVADLLTGQLAVIPWSMQALYFVDLEDQAVDVFDLGVFGQRRYITKGAFLKGNELCTVFTRIIERVGDVDQLQSANQVSCWNRTTKKSSQVTAKNSMAAEGMMTLQLRTTTQPVAKIYLVNGLFDGYDNSSGLWKPNTPGELRVLHPTTLALERKVSVGSVPVDFAVHPVTGDVYVINGGDKSLSIVHPDNSVETLLLAGYNQRDNQRPTSIRLDVAKNRFYITDGYQTLFVYNLATRQEVKRISISPEYGPIDQEFVGDELYVINGNYQGGSVAAINRDSLTVTRTINGLGTFPTGMLEFASP